MQFTVVLFKGVSLMFEVSCHGLIVNLVYDPGFMIIIMVNYSAIRAIDVPGITVGFHITAVITLHVVYKIQRLDISDVLLSFVRVFISRHLTISFWVLKLFIRSISF